MAVQQVPIEADDEAGFGRSVSLEKTSVPVVTRAEGYSQERKVVRSNEVPSSTAPRSTLSKLELRHQDTQLPSML